MITSRLNRQQYPASRRRQRPPCDGGPPSSGLSPCRLPRRRLALFLNATPRRSLPSPAVTQPTPSQSSVTPEKHNSFPELTIFPPRQHGQGDTPACPCHYDCSFNRR